MEKSVIRCKAKIKRDRIHFLCPLFSAAWNSRSPSLGFCFVFFFPLALRREEQINRCSRGHTRYRNTNETSAPSLSLSRLGWIWISNSARYFQYRCRRLRHRSFPRDVFFPRVPDQDFAKGEGIATSRKGKRHSNDRECSS